MLVILCFRNASQHGPCVLFIDELDALCPREEAVEMKERIELLPSLLLFLMVWNLEVNLSLLEQQTDQMLLTQHCEEQADWIERLGINRPFARSGDMVHNKLHWDASYAVGLPKQRNS